jgi:predicted phosphoribosyltransferase
VIIVDDGIATGATTLGAIHEVRLHQPKKLVVAAAVGAPENTEQIRSLVDELVLLGEPSGFFAVGQFFADFPQVTDREAMEIIHQARQNKVERKKQHEKPSAHP